MPDMPFTTTADASGNATATVTHDKAGLQWIIWQLTVESIPYRPNLRATLRRNGRFMTASINGGQDSAQGPPAFKLTETDKLTVDWSGCTPGDQLIATPYYEEVPWGQSGTTFGLV